MGRSRGGLTTKIHLLADTRCRPLARVTSAGQRHDSLALQPLLARLRINRPPLRKLARSSGLPLLDVPRAAHLGVGEQVAAATDPGGAGPAAR